MRRSRHVIKSGRESRRKKSYHRSWLCNECKRHASRRKCRLYHNPSCVRFHTYGEDVRRKRPHRTYYSKLLRVPKDSCEICRARQERHQLRMAVESSDNFQEERMGRERKAFKPDNAEARPWKVMPKDSCEVYRARHKRHQTKIVGARSMSNEKSAGDQIEPQTNEGNRSNSEPKKNTSHLEISSN